MAASDPLLKYQFAVEISGNLLQPAPVYFSEVSGLGVDYSVVEYKTFALNGTPLIVNVPGRPTYPPITLKRGVTSAVSFWQWHRMIYDGQWEKVRASIIITLHDRAYQPVWRWVLANAWPSRVGGLQLSTEGADVLLEELTLVYEGVTLNPMSRGSA